MPGPTLTPPAAMHSTLLACAVSLLCAGAPALAAEDCPGDDDVATTIPTLPRVAASADQDIDFVADYVDGTRDGKVLLGGEVKITQGERRITTRDATYDPATDSFSVDQGVEYVDPNVTVRGAGAHVDRDGGAVFENSQFELPGLSGRGGAGRIRATATGELSLDDVRYTTCPIGNEDWVIRASDIDISQRRGLGTGRGVRLDFKGVPILYAPYFSFPVTNERKSGFLYPTFDTSDSSGTGLSFPWYWNIAENYDATLTPTWYSKRGGKIDTEFRYLTGIGTGIFDAQYLPDDRQFGDARSLLRLTNKSDFTENLRLTIDAANVSDDFWFEDFGSGPEGTSTLFLNREANLLLLTDNWYGVLRAQNFQPIDTSDPNSSNPDRQRPIVAPADRPYTILPQVAVRGWWPRLPYGLALGFDAELSQFDHSFDDPPTPNVTGRRLDVAPEIRMPLRGAGIYLEPAASWRYTAYELEDVTPTAGQPAPDTSPARSTPLFSLDGGMAFERMAGSHGQRVQTFEPRFMYLYVPYRNQAQLPVFDTTAADLNTVQLFRTNRYVGADRLSDANQLSVGFTSRLLDQDTGQQFLAATIGQAVYFDAPRVALPGEVLDDTESSDIVAELDLTAYRNWNVSFGMQWDQGDRRSEKSDVHFQYRPDDDRIMNLGYRFRRDAIEQVDGSIVWPVGDNWGVYGRMVYSLQDNTAINQFAGVEYRSCCWRLRMVARRYVRDITGDTNTSFMVELELNGLSSVGNADSFLERSIQGYSRPSEH